jgi:H+/Cl- antiporter ClcA
LKFLIQQKNQLISTLKKSDTLKGLPFWIAAVLTGIISVLYAKIFKIAEHKFLYLLEFHSNWVFVVTPVGFFVAWLIVHFAAPNARGSGIPQVLASIELAQDPSTEKKIFRHMVSLPITLVKVLSSFITVLCGGAIGREGPTIQISAYVFHAIGDKFQKVWKMPSQDIFFISGGAAGIAAAFNTPLGGVVYAIEELSKSSFHRFRTSLFSAVIISGVVAQILSGPYLFIGVPKISPYSSHVLPYSILIGLVSGIAGALFGKMLYWVSLFRRKIKSPYLLGLLAVSLGLLMACMIVFLNPQSATSGKDLITEYMFHNLPSHISLILVRFFSPIVTYFSGSAGGVFSPALSAGASIGAFIADQINSDYRNTFIMLGMIGFLAGFTSAPFTSFVLILEMTDRHSIVLSMMLTALTASMVSQMVSKMPFYELMKEIFISDEKIQSLSKNPEG